MGILSRDNQSMSPSEKSLLQQLFTDHTYANWHGLRHGFGRSALLRPLREFFLPLLGHMPTSILETGVSDAMIADSPNCTAFNLVEPYLRRPRIDEPHQ